MKSVESVHNPTPLRERLSTRFGLLFAASFLASLVVLGAWALLGMLNERTQAATAEASVQTPVIVIDPKIQQELAKALAFDAIPAVAQVQNPFVDRASLATSVAPSVATSTASRPNASATTTTPGGSSPGTSARNTSIIPPASSSGGAELVYVHQDATKSRYQEWVARQNRGEFVPPESEVLGVDDLVPVGYSSGGDRPPEVMLLSLSLCRTFSFPAGTRFYDGQLNGFDQREVVFIFGNGIRRKSYLSEDACKPASPSTGAMGTGN